ncbi:MAG: O-antigen ligase family protein [Pyrinomonadaceae bacterium]
MSFLTIPSERRTPPAGLMPAGASRFASKHVREPEQVAGLLWPLALAAPFVPGLARLSNGGFTFRQELTVALVLVAAFALLLRRGARTGRADSHTAPRAVRLSAASLAAFVAWTAASALWATNVFAAAHHALSWVAYLLLLALLVRAYASRRVLSASLKLLGAVVFVTAAANVVGHLGSENSLLRANGLGEPLAVSVPLFASLALSARGRRAALLSGLTAALAWLAVLQIAERAAFIAVCAGLFVLAASSLATPRFRPRSKGRAAVVALALLACVAFQYAPSPFEQSRHQPVFARLGSTSTGDLNTRARFLYWGAAFEMWRARPLAGVGANNFSTAMPVARAAFAERHPDSPLSALNEQYLNAGAHNEYLQILAELGAAGFALFVVFCASLVWAAWRALRVARGPVVPGAVASLAVFAVSSGASAVSFRWMGSGLMFFYAAALVLRFAARPETVDESVAQQRRNEDSPKRSEGSRPRGLRGLFDAASAPAPAVGLALALLVAAVMAAQGAHVQLLAAAQSAADAARAEELFREALDVNPLNPSARYQFGVWLFNRGREREAVSHLRFAVERGFNASTCYAYLAGAEANAGDLTAAERTLAEAVRVFPRSVFLRARHASALARAGRTGEAELEMAAAVLLDSRAAHGWRKLIDDDIDAATDDSRRDPETYATPGELQPDEAVFAVLKENEKRFPEALLKGWRAHTRSN